MRKYEIEKVSSMWSTNQLKAKAEKLIEEKTQRGYELLSVSFGNNIWQVPTAFVTFKKK